MKNVLWTRIGWLLLAMAVAVPLTSGAAELAGPIKIGPNGRYFVDQQNKPFYWLGDTAWPLFVQYPTADAEAYLRNRAIKGFTVIQGVLAWSPGGSGAEVKRPAANPEGHHPWLQDNPATPNDAFFRHVDRLVAFAQEQ